MRSLDCLFTGLPDYPIRFSAGDGVCAKFRVVYGQSRVVCVEWLPIYIEFPKVSVPRDRSLTKARLLD